LRLLAPGLRFGAGQWFAQRRLARSDSRRSASRRIAKPGASFLPPFPWSRVVVSGVADAVPSSFPR